MPRMPGVPFVVPRSFSYGRPGGPPKWIIVHYTAGSEGPTAAEDGAAYDQRRRDGTSAHFYADQNSKRQCVDTNDRSHTALYNGNMWGIHIEQCGTVQTRAQWLDPASRGTIRQTAEICAWAMTVHGIPLDRIVARELRTQKGIGGHKDVTLAYPEDGGTHMDPDGNLPGSYPYDILFQDIQAILNPVEEVEEMYPEKAIVPADSVDVTMLDTSQSPLADGNLLGYDLRRTGQIHKMVMDPSTGLAALHAKVDALGNGGVPIDYDLLADKVVDKMSSRLAD